MHWIAIAIAFVGVLYFAIHYRGFRKVLAWTVAGLVVLGALGGAYAYWQDVREKERRAYALTLIGKNEIDFFDLTLASTTISGHLVEGKVRNRSSQTLKSFKLLVTVETVQRDASARSSARMIIGRYSSTFLLGK